MSKIKSLMPYILGSASYLTIYAIYMVAFAVLAPAHASTFPATTDGIIAGEARFETAAYATYTPAMVARGQRFYIGP